MTRSQGENRFYVHEVYATNEKGTSPFKTGTTASSRTPGEDVPSVISILNSIREVKKKSKNAVESSPAHRLRVLSAYISAGRPSHVTASSATFDMTPETQVPHSTDNNSIPQPSPARQPAMPDFSGRSLDEPISDAEFRAAYEARIAREIAAERARTESDNTLGEMLSGEMTNDRADAIAKDQALAAAFESLTGTKLTGSLAQKRKQIRSLQTYAAELLRAARVAARMHALADANTREINIPP